MWDFMSKKINNYSIHDISDAMQISESKVKSLKLESYLKNPKKHDEMSCLEEIAEKIKSGDIKPELYGDKIRFILDDPILKREFENSVKKFGGHCRLFF